MTKRISDFGIGSVLAERVFRTRLRVSIIELIIGVH